MMKHFQILLKISLAFGVAFLMSKCSDDDEVETRMVTFNFEVQVDNKPVEFDSKKYVTALDQSVSFERLSAYVSNVKLKGASAEDLFIEQASYHLISFDADRATASFEIENVPSTMQVSEVIFSIGVDPGANTSIDHIGDLDPTNGMAWDWNTGYKFLSLEGRYFADGDPRGEEIKMHIGTDKNYFEKVYLLESPIDLSQSSSFQFTVDAMSPFGTLDLSEGTVFMNDERGDEVAHNYKSQLIQPEESFGFVK